LGYPYFWKHPFRDNKKVDFLLGEDENDEKHGEVEMDGEWVMKEKNISD